MAKQCFWVFEPWRCVTIAWGRQGLDPYGRMLLQMKAEFLFWAETRMQWLGVL